MFEFVTLSCPWFYPALLPQMTPTATCILWTVVTSLTLLLWFPGRLFVLWRTAAPYEVAQFCLISHSLAGSFTEDSFTEDRGFIIGPFEHGIDLSRLGYDDFLFG